ncbi:hypothetical protein [Nocardia sp. NPDC049149]|uniref:hypothetical protein n=1 Tax=Nocardia sp. NPDC049149 TaxID=3364315 RepID=UPI00371AD1CF
MSEKILLLRSLRSEDEMDRRWAEDYQDEYDRPRLFISDGIELSDEYPAGLRALYRLSDSPAFGDVYFNPQHLFKRQPPIDDQGNCVRDGNLIQIGSVDEQSLLLDLDTGAALIFDFLYFRHGLADGFVLECPDVAELVNTVALGPRYSAIHGPHGLWAEPWWTDDPWYNYLVEIGMIVGS